MLPEHKITKCMFSELIFLPSKLVCGTTLFFAYKLYGKNGNNIICGKLVPSDVIS